MKTYSKFVCQSCGYQSASMLGRCPTCGEFSTFVEEVVRDISSAKKNVVGVGGGFAKSEKLSEIKSGEFKRIPTGFLELDRVLGGSEKVGSEKLDLEVRREERENGLRKNEGDMGIVPGSVMLLSGEPGMGKSTILLQLAFNLASRGEKVLYVTGEESGQQIKLRARRLEERGKRDKGDRGDKGTMENILILADTDTDNICEQIESLKPTLAIVDSIQTITTLDMTGVAGSVGQVRESAYRISAKAKGLGVPVVLVGHVTKDGTIAGPKVLEHLVDVVLYLEGERTQGLRIIRGVKNRYGATDEVGVFKMTDRGLSEVLNPSELFLEERVKSAPGTVVTAVLEGTRPVLVEIQALVVPTTLPIPRRVANGIDNYRLQLLTAILTKRLGIPLGTFDIFVNVASGLIISERASDLAVCLAIISSQKNIAISSKTIAFGEVGLLGEVRKVSQMERRVKEAKKLGFTTIVSPLEVKSLAEAARIGI